MRLDEGEHIIWKEYPLSTYRRNFTIAITIIGIILMLTVFLFFVGIIMLVLGLTMYFLLRSANQYVVTSKRALHLKFGKVVKEVPLDTPNLLVSAVNQQFIGNRYAGNYVVQDVVFIQNGIELMRFSKVHKGDELIAKLKSMGFQST
ncbi:MAG: hypothetical protein QXO96_01930 [Sulfolobales archaeon]